MLTKACIWGNNLYNAGKGKVLEQVRMAGVCLASVPRMSQRSHQAVWIISLDRSRASAYDNANLRAGIH